MKIVKPILIVIITLVGLTIYGKITGVFNVNKTQSLSNNENNVSTQQVQTPQERILGVWVMENTPSDKIEFLANGQMKHYEDGVLLYVDTYSFANSCGNETLALDSLFLKQIDSEDGDEYCYYVNGINENNSGILSLTTQNQGKVIIYHRQ